MSDSHSFSELDGFLRRGDNQAAAEVFHRFAGRLIGLARTRLDPKTLTKVDPEDVVQSVFRSFFTRYADGQFDVDGWSSLWTVLTLITVRKCRNQVARFRMGRRNADLEISLEDLAEQLDGQTALTAHEPTPSEACILAETLEQLMRGLVPREREMLTLHLQGHDVTEISRQIGRAERTVRRVLQNIRRELEESAFD